jgi:hypothetical protein
MGAPTSSYATAGIALRVSGALKPHHHDKVETSSVGHNNNNQQTKQTPWLVSASELYRPTERPPLVGEVSANFSG